MEIFKMSKLIQAETGCLRKGRLEELDKYLWVSGFFWGSKNVLNIHCGDDGCKSL